MQRTPMSFAANIPKYIAFVALKGFNFGLFVATWVIFLQHRHDLSLTQVTLVDVAFWIAATLGELPTGVVADSYGRKVSLIVGAAVMSASVFVWTFAPNVPLVVSAYAILAIGATFLSGAEDALFFETLKITGRAAEYTRLAGRVSAISLAAIAIGNVFSGLVATIDLRLPFAMSALCLLSMLGIALTFREPNEEGKSSGSARLSYEKILKNAFSIMRAKPSLRYAIFYLTLVPITAMAVETVFLQPQAIALGVPLAAIGIVVMGMQLARMVGATFSYRVKEIVGEARMIYLVPFAIAASLLLLGTFQQLPALAFAATISLFTAMMRPLVMARIQSDLSDNIRATVFSMQALLFAFVVAFIEPVLGAIADETGLPTMYYTMAIGLALLTTLLFWRSRGRFP
jgi:MFS family permease